MSARRLMPPALLRMKATRRRAWRCRCPTGPRSPCFPSPTSAANRSRGIFSPASTRTFSPRFPTCAATEPQISAAENFRARRKPPESMDAWDLVMRALSHYWRLTRQDNVVAQALLEKATTIDPTYGQALGVLATSQTFCAHMGWADMAAAVPIAERAALAAIQADSEDPWAHHALGSVYLQNRRFEDSLAEFEL